MRLLRKRLDAPSPARSLAGSGPRTGLALVFMLSFSALVAACGTPTARVPPSPDRIALASQPVTDARFPQAVNELLMSEPGSAERKARLAGVLGRQMSRAAQRFDDRFPDAGTAAVRGALTLVRVGDLTEGALGPDGPRALRGAAIELARRGDDGRSRAIYELLVKVLPESERAEPREHLEAVKAWTQNTATGGAMQAAGALETAAVARRMLEPSVEAREEATARTAAWIAQSFEVRRIFRERRVQPEREEAMEALRALGTGPTVLAALHLRDADAHGALAALDRAEARDLTRPDILAAIERVADRAESSSWLALLRALRSPARDGDEAPQDIELLRTVTFCIAAEAYRLDPQVPEVAGVVSEALIELGMPDAAPAVLVAAVRAHPDPNVLSGAMSITLLALLRSAELDDLASARRAFEAAAPLLAIADDTKLSRRTNPSSARVRAAMGELEVRHGHLQEGERLLVEAARHEKSGAILLSLARISAHGKRLDDAQDKLKEALGREDTFRDPALRGETLLFQGDLLREAGDREGARAVYRRALEDLARVRPSAEGDLRARVERLLARLLDRFGETSAADRALDRAFEAASRDKRQAAATVGQQVARAFLRRDVRSAQGGLLRGVSAQLSREDLVYYAVWTRILEREALAARAVADAPPRPPSHRPPAHAPPAPPRMPPSSDDGLAEKVLSQAATDPRWIGKIAAFGLGKLPPDDLLRAAKTPGQRTEALFYGAMAKRLSGDAIAAEGELRRTIAEGSLDLMEVALAHDLLSADRGVLGGPAPNVGLP